ncbi:hypothetical protein V1514DRAFT_207149 [Lipomyces japonicus]|uniref:uncharacterized protein n=1 Tax=Lipomyces japonicus TaxID=56871 RepID=UPI0034CE9D22
MAAVHHTASWPSLPSFPQNQGPDYFMYARPQHQHPHQPVRHVPHSPSVTFFGQASPSSSSSSSPGHQQASPPDRYRRGHRRSDASISSIRSVSAPCISITPQQQQQPQPQVNAVHRSWSSSSLPAVESSPKYPLHSPCSPEQYFYRQRQRQLQQQQTYQLSAPPPQPILRHPQWQQQPQQHPPPLRHGRQLSVDSVASSASRSSSGSSSSNNIAVEHRKSFTVERVLPAQSNRTSKSFGRFRKALSFISSDKSFNDSSKIESEVIEYHFGNTSIYDIKSMRKQVDSNNDDNDDDTASINSTASSVSKAWHKLGFRRSKSFSSNSDESVLREEVTTDVADVADVAAVATKDPAVAVVREVAVGSQNSARTHAVARKGILKKASSNSSNGVPITIMPVPELLSESLVISSASSSTSSISSGLTTPSQQSQAAAGVSFSPHIKVYNTWNPQDYDRKLQDPVPYASFSPWMIEQIKDEINMFKKMEMEIHESSRSNTCFY